MLNLKVLFLPGLREWPQTSASKLTVFRCYTFFFQLFIIEKISTLIFFWYFISLDQESSPICFHDLSLKQQGGLNRYKTGMERREMKKEPKPVACGFFSEKEKKWEENFKDAD